MEPFSQTVVRGSDLPDVLSPRLFKSSRDFAITVNSALSRAYDSTPVLGVATLLTVEDALLEAIAVATSKNEIFVLYTRSSPFLGIKDLAVGLEVLSPLLRGQSALLVGFSVARIAMHVRYGLNTHVRGVELAEAASPKERNLSPGAFVKNYVDPTANTFAVDILWDALPTDLEHDSSRLEHLALRAWLTARVASSVGIQQGLIQCIPADTTYLTSKHYKPIQQMLIEVEQMEASKSRVQENDFKGTAIDDNGNVVIANDRFNNRVRPSDRKEVWMIDETDGLHRGTARRANGKLTHVAPRSNLGGVSFKAIFVIGKDEFNHPDRARENFLLRILQRIRDLNDPDYDLIQKLFFPDPRETYPQKVSGATRMGRLNQSQADVVGAMVDSEAPFVIVHGPPGTGKTSTISAALQDWVQMSKTVWVVSQSNVAVKNIAERLSKDEVPYRLLVSKEFYHEWHEHIYDERVKESLIRTDELPARAQDIEIIFHGIRVVLCTLSVLSNPSLEAKNVFDVVPVTRLVVDEASQIGIFGYMHVFAQFRYLSKVCFFGDPKQLPPFGQDAAKTVQSVFDVRHLKSQSYFLNTQYRMPVPLGSFISNAVYDGKLRSEHQISSHSCVAFIDVSLGEEENDKKSYINTREVQTVEHLVRHYYQSKDYCIITPYDAQRNLLQKTLENAGLRSDNIYNVDSFQGNEADFIIISVVRSVSPGFLVSRNRVNVMLTRCKVGMVIVTGQAFMRQWKVQKTVLGEMLQNWENKCGQEDTWRDWKAVADRTADLPGASGRGNGAVSQVGSSLKSNLRSPARTLSSAEERIRQPMVLGAGLSAPSLPLDRSKLEFSVGRKLGDLSATRPNVDRLAEELRQTRIGTGAPGLFPAQSQARSKRSALSQKDDCHRGYNSAFPELASASRPRLQTSGAWRNGPPLSSQPKSLSGASLPSQKLSVLKKQVPSEILGSTRKKVKREKVVMA